MARPRHGSQLLLRWWRGEVVITLISLSPAFLSAQEMEPLQPRQPLSAVISVACLRITSCPAHAAERAPGHRASGRSRYRAEGGTCAETERYTQPWQLSPAHPHTSHHHQQPILCCILYNDDLTALNIFGRTRNIFGTTLNIFGFGIWIFCHKQKYLEWLIEEQDNES